MATTRDPAHESVNLLTLLPAGHTLTDVSDPAYPSDLDTTRWLYHEPTGLLTNKLYADGKGTAYSYSPDGKLATRTWARLVVPPSGGAPVPLVTSYGYEPGGSLTNILYSDSTPAVTFAYDRLGRQKTVIDASGSRAFAYNDLLQLAAETNAMAVVERRYDSLGLPAGLEVGRSSPSEPSPYAVTYAYDSYGRFHSVSSSVFSAISVVNYSRLPGTDLISGWTDSISGASVSRSYEAHRDLLVAVTNSVGATMISAYDYANDALGRRTQRLDAGANAATNVFAYNVRSELTNAVMPVAGQGDQRYSWTLDPIGNRTATTHNDETRTFVANELNQYTNIVADSVPAELHYDWDGNLTNDAVFAYAYNGENRLTLAEPLAPAVGAKRVRNAYDHQGRRFEKVVDQWTGTAWANVATNRFLYDGWNVVAEYSHAPTPPYVHTNFFVRGLDLSGTLQGAGGIGGLLSIHTFAPLASFAVHYPFHDANGNLVQTVDSNGTVTASYVYDAYGATLTQAGPFADENPYRFSSQYFDAETALYMYIFRAYSPKLERWVNRDPIGERGGRNLVTCVANSPILRVDPLGLQKKSYVRPPRDFSCCVPRLRDEGLEAMRSSYATIYATLTEEDIPHGKKGDTVSCAAVNSRVFDQLSVDGIPYCWSCTLVRRWKRPFIRWIDHWVVVCREYGTIGQVVREVIFDYWADRNAGEDATLWFYVEYPFPSPDDPPFFPPPKLPPVPSPEGAK